MMNSNYIFMGKIKLILYLQLLIFSSCSSNFYNYEADWVLNNIYANDSSIVDTIGMYNFKIDVQSGIGHPPGIFIDKQYGTNIIRPKCKVRFYKEGGKDYLVISEHFFFEDTYLIKCLDDNCCSLSLIGKRISMTLNHNRNISSNRKDKCPQPSLPS